MKLEATEKSNITLDKVLTVGEFVKVVRKRTGNNKIDNPTIHYHLNNTDRLNYIVWCGMCLIVQDEKAAEFSPGTGDYYSKKNRSTESF